MMSTEIQKKDKARPDIQKSSRNSRRLRLILTTVIAIVFALLFIVAQVLGSLQIIPGVWTTISSAVVGGLGILFAFIPLLSMIFPSEQQPQQITHVPVPVIVSGGTAQIASTTTQSVEGS